MKKYRIITGLLLMTALCGCTTQSIEDAKGIEETNTYVYLYETEAATDRQVETETNSEGQMETQTPIEKTQVETTTRKQKEKPSVDMKDFETAERVTSAALRKELCTFLKMNEKYTSGNLECTVKEAHLSTSIDYADEILDSEVIDACKDFLKKKFPTGKTDDEIDEKILWVKIHINSTYDKDLESYLETVCLRKGQDDEIRSGTSTLQFIDKEKYIKEGSGQRGVVNIKANSEMDLWYVFRITKYEKEKFKYYLIGKLGYLNDPSRFIGTLIELNDIKDEG